MNVVALRLRSPLQLFAALLLLALLPFVGMSARAAALDVPNQHSMHGQQIESDLDCAAACARTTVVPPTQAIIDKDETRTPDPEPSPYVPYHLRFQFAYTAKIQRPNPNYHSSPARPPDIVKMSAHYRF